MPKIVGMNAPPALKALIETNAHTRRAGTVSEYLRGLVILDSLLMEARLEQNIDIPSWVLRKYPWPALWEMHLILVKYFMHLRAYQPLTLEAMTGEEFPSSLDTLDTRAEAALPPDPRAELDVMKDMELLRLATSNANSEAQMEWSKENPDKPHELNNAKATPEQIQTKYEAIKKKTTKRKTS